MIGHATTIGTPQGGCISPILANILLNELDQILDQRKIRFVRYADDMVVFCGSRKAAERILEGMKKILENKLFLKVNETKTKIIKVSKDVQFLGFTFTNRVKVSRKEQNPSQRWFPTVHLKKLVKIRNVLEDLLDRKCPEGLKKTKEKLTLKLRGWCNYFKGCIAEKWMNQMDGWIRRRIRQIYWKQWKKPANRAANFKKRWSNAPGIEEYAYSSNSYWRMAKTPQINKALSNKQLQSDGWVWIRMFGEEGRV